MHTLLPSIEKPWRATILFLQVIPDFNNFLFQLLELSRMPSIICILEWAMDLSTFNLLAAESTDFLTVKLDNSSYVSSIWDPLKASSRESLTSLLDELENIYLLRHWRGAQSLYHLFLIHWDDLLPCWKKWELSL
jgi:hypothetical protein